MSLWSAFIILVIGLNSMIMLISQYASWYSVRKDFSGLYIFFRKIRKGFFFLAVLGSVFFFALSPWFNAYVKVDRYDLNLMLAVSFALYVVLTPYIGLAQGTQNFVCFSVHLALMGFVKVLAGIVFLCLGLKIGGAFLTLIITFALQFPVFRNILCSICPADQEEAERSFRYPNERFLSAFFSYGIVLILANVLFNLLSLSDAVFAKRFFSPTDAGIYSSAAVLARIMLFLPAPIILAVFPKVSEYAHGGRDPIHILTKSLGLLSLILGGISIGFFLFPELIVTFLLGGKSAAAAPILKYLGPALAPAVLVSLIMNYDLARMKYKVTLFTMAAGFTGMTYAIYRNHDSLHDLVSAVAIANIAIVLVCLTRIYGAHYLFKNRIEFPAKRFT
jgi:O-antigen/teichoic acid export membrane protein